MELVKVVELFDFTGLETLGGTGGTSGTGGTGGTCYFRWPESPGGTK